MNSQVLGKDHNAGKDWEQEEKGATEDGMVGWHHWLNRCEFEQTPGDVEGQRSLACCSPWGRKELDTTEWLNNKPVHSFLQLGQDETLSQPCACPLYGPHAAYLPLLFSHSVVSDAYSIWNLHYENTETSLYVSSLHWICGRKANVF